MSTDTLAAQRGTPEADDPFAGPKVMGDDGQFHAEDEAVDFSDTPAEAWLALAFFWVLGLTVLYQFITRYVFNDSASWTEEIARYFLVCMVFVGAAIGVAKNNHIQVDFFYRHLPRGITLWLSRAVDVLRTAFLFASVGLTWQLMQRLGSTTRMTIVDLPMDLVYGVCLFGFLLMALRSLWVTRIHWQRGYSVLERPETTLQDRA